MPADRTAHAVNRAHDALLNDAVTSQLFDCMRQSAGVLPFLTSPSAVVLEDLAARCARDLALDADTIQFLMAKVRIQRQYETIARTRNEWRKRLARLPKRSARPRIILILSEGQAVRSFLVTDACLKLAQWAELCVLSSFDIEADVLALGPIVHFFPIPVITRTLFDTLTMYLGYLHTESPTNRQMVQRLDEGLQKAQAAGDPITGNLRIWQIARKFTSQADYIKVYGWSLRFFAQIFALRECCDLVSRLHGDIIVNTSTTTWESRLWMRAAALEGLPSVANVISWDNMSTKTLLDEFADTFLLWSEEMDEDFAGTVPFLRNRRRVIVGSPQFEPVINKRGLLPRTEFFRRYGMDPDKELILYTTGSITIAPHEPVCLDRVLHHWRDNLSGRANIMVRMHPKDRQGRYEEVQRKFPEVPFTLAGQKLAVYDEWVPTREDIDLLVNQLHHCQVVVNVASTMTLEGFAIDKPAINIGFTPGRSVSLRYPMEDYYKSRHYSDVVSSGAARLASDYVELFAAIDDVLDRNLYDVEAQRRILRRKCLYAEDSSDRIDAFLRQYLAINRSFPRWTRFLARPWRALVMLLSRLIQVRPVRRLLRKMGQGRGAWPQPSHEKDSSRTRTRRHPGK